MHPAVHIAFGVLTATCLMLPSLLKAWWRAKPLAKHFRNMLLTSAALGLYAVIPSVLARMGMPESWRGSAWMNVFLLHAYIARVRPGGGFIGPLMLTALFAFQYILLVLAVIRNYSGARVRGSGNPQGDDP